MTLAHTARVYDFPAVATGRELNTLLQQALDQPIGADHLEASVKPGDRVLIIISDETRDEPRDIMVAKLLERLPRTARITLAIATGTHGPANLDALGLTGGQLKQFDAVINHDGLSDLVLLGTTRRGTPLRVHRALAEADWVIATGRIKPHYFAGFSAGAKALFPGLGGQSEIRTNHKLKQSPRAVAGNITDNPCRADLEEIIEYLPGTATVLNIVLAPDGSAQGAVYGDVITAFRQGAQLSAASHTLEAIPCECIIVSDALPLTASLYQASKLVAAVAPVAKGPNVTIILVAECAQGIGGVDTVNQAIYQIGIAPRLPRNHRIVLVSSLERTLVAQSYCEWARSVDHVLKGVTGPVAVFPHAGSAIVSQAGHP